MISLGRTQYGVASKLRTLKSGVEYDHLFEKAPGKVYTEKRDAGLQDTVEFIPRVVMQTRPQTKLISQDLKRNNVYDTCKSIWHFVYQHIQYRKDKQGYEQIRSPRRTWHDRKQGVDCDCYSVFISSILTNLSIDHILRITKYNEDHFQHIYPVVPYRGRHIIIDCVTDQFDYEVPFSEKKDYPMDLQFLDGIPDYNNYSIGELGKVKKKKALVTGTSPASSKKKKKGIFKKVGAAVKKVNVKKIVSKINKLNPAAIAIRNGILAAMKLNVMNLGKRLRWSYLTPEQAVSKGIEPDKFQRLLKTRQKLENIFTVGGGKVSNLKKAVLKGKGNKDKQVSVNGLDGLGSLSCDASGMDIHTPLEQLLGADIFYSENVEGFSGMNGIGGLGELGEPVTLATVGAAMGVLTGILTQLKQIGNIFKGKQPGSEDFDEATNEAAENNQPVPDTTPLPDTATNPIVQHSIALPDTSSNQSETAQLVNDGSSEDDNAGNSSEGEPSGETDDTNNESQRNSNTSSVPAKTSTAVAKTNNNTPDKESFWQKKWVKPTAIIGGSLLLVMIAAKALGGNHEKNKSSPHNKSLDGIPHRRKKHKRKRKHKKLRAIALQ